MLRKRQMSSDLHSAPQPLRSLQGPAFFAKVGWPDSARLLRLFDALRSDDAAVVSASIAEDGFTCTRLDELSDESSSAPALTAGLFASPAAEAHATLRMWQALTAISRPDVAVMDLDERDGAVHGARQITLAFTEALTLGSIALGDAVSGAATKTSAAALNAATAPHDAWTATALAIELELVTLRSAADAKRGLTFEEKKRLRELESVAPMLRNALLEVDGATRDAPALVLPAMGGLAGFGGKPSKPVTLPPTSLCARIVDDRLATIATECSLLTQMERLYAALALPLGGHRYAVERIRELRIRSHALADDGTTPRERHRTLYACGDDYVELASIPRWSDYIASGSYAEHRGGAVPPWRGFLEKAGLPIAGRPTLTAGASVIVQIEGMKNKIGGVVERDCAKGCMSVDVRFPVSSTSHQKTKVLTVPKRSIDGWSLPATPTVPRSFCKRSATPNAALNAKISLYQGDMTTLEVDCIVNAANGLLLGGGGVDGAVHKAAGAWLKEECRLHAGALDGEAKLTRGYDLPAQYILHAVGPRCQYRSKREGGGVILDPPALRQCYRSCLDLVSRHGLRTVAFCSISTGIFGYPLHDATSECLGIVRAWLECDGNADKVDRIIFVTFSDVDTAAYQAILPAYFPAEGSEEGGDCRIC